MDNKKSLKSVLLLSLSAVSLLLVGGVGGYFLSKSINGLDEDEQKLIEEYRILKDDWLFADDSDSLIDYALSGLASGFSESGNDPYTFYTPTLEDQNLSVSHLGFGITTHAYDGGFYVTEVHDGPAKGFLQVGDVLYGVQRGNEEYRFFPDHSIEENTSYLSDSAYLTSPYLFTYVRDGEEKTVTLRKSNFEEEIVQVLEEPSPENNRTLAIRISTFLGEPSAALDKLLERYSSQEIDCLVLDLRGNTGGYVDECEKMAKLFVRKGQLIDQLIDRDGKVLHECKQESNPKYSFPEYKLIIDSNSASASETFALAMRAGTNSTLYGLPSYGKGIAQNVRTYSDGSTLRYTYAYVYGPEKEDEWMYGEGEDDDDILCIHGKGIQPDVLFDTDYLWLSNTPRLSSSLSVSLANQNHLLNLLNLLPLESEIPSSYNADYHFHDALLDFSIYIKNKYQYDTSLNLYQENGCVSLPLENKVSKESYDLYLQYYEKLLKEVLDD